MISVVVPACNEEAVIGRTLSTLLHDAESEEFDVVVVCNGCTDDTARIARSFAPSVRVIETATPSKANALNLGDEATNTFPRFYLDADVRLSTADVRVMSEALEGRPASAVTASLRMDTSNSSWGVRAYHRIWVQLPAIRHGLVGRGVYGVNETGRRRFGRFPELIADDLFVQLVFDEASRVSVASSTSVVEAPRSLTGLVQRKTRSFVGNAQLRQSWSSGPSAYRGSDMAWLSVVAQEPKRALDAPVYVFVTLVAKARAWWRLRKGDVHTWDRDDTTRGEAGPQADISSRAGNDSARHERDHGAPGAAGRFHP